MKTVSPLDPPPEQLELWEQDIRVPTKKVLFRIDEVATLLEVSTDQVRLLADSGALESIPISVAVDPERTHRRITARSIEAFLNQRRKMV